MLLYYEVTIRMVRIMKGLFTTLPDAVEMMAQVEARAVVHRVPF